MADAIVIIGMMGSGKTSVGRKLAQLLSQDFVDTDVCIQDATGKSPAELVRADPVDFRAREAATIAELLDSDRRFVMSVGGGALSEADTIDRIRKARAVVWLTASVDVLVTRALVDGAHSRPMLDGDPYERMNTLSQNRRSSYASVATHVVETGDADVDVVAERIRAMLT